MKELSVFKRGQVWYINDNRRNVGSIQGKSRPYLVVSNDKCNTNSPVIHMAPITTQDKNKQPTHVIFYDPHNRSMQTVLIEQTMPKSVPDITPVAEYKYTLSEEKMTEVDKAIAAQFGIPYGGVTMDDFEELLDMIKERKLAEIRAEAEKLTSDKVNAYTDRLLEAVDQIKVPEPVPQSTTNTTPDPPKKSAPMSQIEKFNQRLQKADPTKFSKPISNITSTDQSSSATTPIKEGKRNRWSEELKRQFIADADNKMPTEQICEKYGITTSTYRTQLSKFRKELGILTKRRLADTTKNYKTIDPVKFLKDYDSKPISEVVIEYELKDKKAAVELAANCRSMLGKDS